MRNRIKLFNYPFLNAGVTFKADELNLRAEKFITGESVDTKNSPFKLRFGL